MNGKKTILHIAYLSDDRAKGPNNNVPKNIVYGNQWANVGLLNLHVGDFSIDVPKDVYFSIKSFKSVSELPEPFNDPDVVVFQGVYFIQYCRIARWLKNNNIPYIIVPRCSMTTAALKSHSIKKRIANALLFNNFIHDAYKIHFLTQNEYLESRNNFKFNDYFILGNGIDIPLKKYKQKKRNDPKIVFVGRYNVYHKGLDLLLDAINLEKGWFEKNKVFLMLYGSNSDNGLKAIKKQIVSYNLEKIVKICGPVFGIDKENALLDADVFIHTSRLEGQPTSVMEAISYGVPVIVTPGTNVVDIVTRNKLGFVAEMNAESILANIKKAFDEKKSFDIISKSEVKYAEKNLKWDEIVCKSLGNYLGKV